MNSALECWCSLLDVIKRKILKIPMFSFFIAFRKIQIPLRFPAEHPYTSHMAKFQTFPSFESPEDIWKGKGAVAIQPTLPATAPASAPDPTVFEKAKGHSKRKELVTVQHESRRKPLTWPEHNLLQVDKKKKTEKNSGNRGDLPPHV